MCGIFCYFDKADSGTRGIPEHIVNAAMLIQHRGPDTTQMLVLPEAKGWNKQYAVFHRLAINGMTPESGQPLFYPIHDPTVYLLCNGEIYNFRDLIQQYGITDYHSGSDCEIILHLYAHYKETHTDLTAEILAEMVSQLHGEFAFTLIDRTSGLVLLGRDPLGVRSMYYSVDDRGYGVCSELKGLYPLADPATIHQFPAGSIGILQPGKQEVTIVRYYNTVVTGLPESKDDLETIISKLQITLVDAVLKRLMCDRHRKNGDASIGAFLSGGFDSSMIAGILSKLYHGKLHTFSIGFKDAPDLLAARQVAKFIGSEHHEVVVTEDEMMEVLGRVTRTIESYDVTTNRASAFMLKLSEYVRDNTDIAVIYSGEVSDELFGSYMYFHNAPDSDSFQQETLRLMRDLQYFDLLRGDKSSAAAGLEIRVPLADVSLLDLVISISPELKLANGTEKYIVREAVFRMGVIPDQICWRTKEAMSDGVSLHQRSWSVIIQEMAVAELAAQGVHDINPVEAERQWFMKKFKSHYAGCEHTIPYYWLPKWCGDVTDASARTLDVYKNRVKSEE